MLTTATDKKVLVTGATGYVGQHLVPSLLKENYTVYVLTREKDSIFMDNKQVTTIVGDITDPIDLPDGIETIYHCAGVIRELAAMEKVNVQGTQNIVNVAIGNNCTLIYLSSAGIVGETKEKILDERTSCNPQNAYEISKYRAEQVVLDGINKGLKTHILRPSTIFGAKKHPEQDSFFQLLKSMRTGYYKNVGQGMYNIVHIDEVVRALRLLGEASVPFRGIYIISNAIAYKDLNILVRNIPPVVHRATANIPYLGAWGISVALSLLCPIVRKKNPLTLSRLHALTNEQIYSQEKLLKETVFKNVSSVEDYLKTVCKKYIELGLLP
jgi:nucleoside-diphosphate-sugar epimerase